MKLYLVRPELSSNKKTGLPLIEAALKNSFASDWNCPRTFVEVILDVFADLRRTDLIVPSFKKILLSSGVRAATLSETESFGL